MQLKVTSKITGVTVDIETHMDKIVDMMLGPKTEDDPTYDSSTDVVPKGIYRGHELPIADYLMSFQDALRKEFLDYYGSLEEFERTAPSTKADDNPNSSPVDRELVRTKAKLLDPTKDEDESVGNVDAWKVLGLKYHNPVNNSTMGMPENSLKKLFPTSYKLIQEFGNDAPIIAYSYISPQSQLHRHTGIENRSGEFIRIHIPIIVPEGDVFFEVNDEEVKWNDIFAFDNQLVHSAHNLSDKGRVIYQIDIRRSRAGLPPGTPYRKERQRAATSIYIRKPKV